jgi:DNA-binding response OmpR family regulator
MANQPTVLVVDDERDLAELYAAWLEADHEVRTAYSGDEAIRTVDETIDVVLLDRLMPEMPGGEVLEHIRRVEYDCRVAMVTAVEPDFDIIEMGFDEYVVKPLQRDDLAEVVDSLLTRSEYDEKLQEFFALAAKRAALRTGKTTHELQNSDAYAELVGEFERLRAELDRTTDELSVRDLEAELRQINANT